MYHSVEGVDNGGAYASIRAWGMWEISVSCSQLCCECKTSLKNCVLLGLMLDFYFLFVFILY